MKTSGVGHRTQGKAVASEKTETRVPIRIKDAETLQETTLGMLASIILRSSESSLKIQIHCKKFYLAPTMKA